MELILFILALWWICRFAKSAIAPRGAGALILMAVLACFFCFMGFLPVVFVGSIYYLVENGGFDDWRMWGWLLISGYGTCGLLYQILKQLNSGNPMPDSTGINWPSAISNRVLGRAADPPARALTAFGERKAIDE